jgi:hypothetical protein
MKDIKKIQEFFSKPLEEMMSLDDQAKAYYLEKFKKGEISSLPEDPKAAFLDQMMKDEIEKDAAQYRRETGLEEVSAEYSRRNKRPIKVGDIVGNTVQGFDFKVLDIQDDLMKVKNFITGKEFMTDIDNMSLLYPDESINEAKFTDYSNNELAAYAKELSKQRADAASKGQSDLVSGINKEIEAATRELKKRSQALKGLSRTDVKEPVGEEVKGVPVEKTPATITRKEWDKTPKNDKAIINGIAYVERYDRVIGTYMAPIKIVDEIEETELTEAFVPRNIAEFAERKGVSRLVKTVAGWAEKVGKRIMGGTAIGKNYDTLILDMTFQGSEIRINTEYETVELYDEPVRTFAQFKRVYEENQEENLDEAMGGQLDEKYFIEVSVRDARKAIEIFRDQYSNADIEMYGSNVYASNDFGDISDFYMSLMAGEIEILDSSDFDEEPFDFEDEDENLFEVKKGFGDKISPEAFARLKGQVVNYFGNKYKVTDSDEFTITIEDEDGETKTINLNQFIQKGLIPELKKKIQETIKLGKNLNEELCAKGKAYIKKRQAAGEKSSAYLSGRAVKVCKGQMKG